MNLISIEINNKGKTYHYPSEWSEITLKHYIDFMKLKDKYDVKPIEDKEKEHVIEEHDVLNDHIFMAEVVDLFTDIPRDIIFNSMTPKDIVHLASNIEFMNTDYPKGFCTKFNFRSVTSERVKELQKEYDSVPAYKIAARRKIKKELKSKTNLEFLISYDLGFDSLAQWIAVNNLYERMEELRKRLIGLDFEVLPEIIAHISRTKGQEYNSSVVKEMIPVFEELPFDVAYKISNFFLLTLKGFTKSSNTSLTLKKDLTKMNRLN